MMMSTKEITETRIARTSVHRVGPFTGVCAVVLWGAALAFVITVVAMATPNWTSVEDHDVGLWKICPHSLCPTLLSSVIEKSLNGIRAITCLAMISSLVTFLLALVYTFVHSVSKGLVINLYILAAALSAIFMTCGLACFATWGDGRVGVSFYLAVVACVLHIVVAIAGDVQKNKSDACVQKPAFNEKTLG